MSSRFGRCPGNLRVLDLLLSGSSLLQPAFPRHDLQEHACPDWLNFPLVALCSGPFCVSWPCLALVLHTYRRIAYMH